METFKGTVSKLKRDYFIRPYADSDEAGRVDLTDFELAGKSMQYRTRSTEDSISEGDVLVVAGTSKGKVFQVLVFRNLTKNITSYKGHSLVPVRLGVALMMLSAICVSAYSYFYIHAMAFLPITVLAIFVCISGFVVYLDFRYRNAIKSIENYK